jgi:hypothetical protein
MWLKYKLIWLDCLMLLTITYTKQLIREEVQNINSNCFMNTFNNISNRLSVKTYSSESSLLAYSKDKMLSIRSLKLKWRIVSSRYWNEIDRMFYCMIERELFLMAVNDDLQTTDELLFPSIFCWNGNKSNL